MQLELPTQTQQPNEHAFSMFDNQKHHNMLLPSISKELDEFFAGGLHKGTITQLYGEAGCGKTQIAMMFALGVHFNPT